MIDPLFFASVLVRRFLPCRTGLCYAVEIGIVVVLLALGLWNVWQKASKGNDDLNIAP